MNLTVLQRISWYNFVYFSLIYLLPPNDGVLCSFVITEQIPTSRPLINLTLWSSSCNGQSNAIPAGQILPHYTTVKQMLTVSHSTPLTLLLIHAIYFTWVWFMYTHVVQLAFHTFWFIRQFQVLPLLRLRS